MPGGSSFMRNPAVPLEVVYPSGIPEHYIRYNFIFYLFFIKFYYFYYLLNFTIFIRRQLNIDMSNVPLDQPYANKVFVDSVNKRYWIDK